MKFKNRQNSAVRSQDNAYFWRGKSEQWVGRSKTRFWVILFVLTWAVPTRVCWFCRNGWAVQLWFMFFSVYILYLKKFFLKGGNFSKGLSSSGSIEGQWVFWPLGRLDQGLGSVITQAAISGCPLSFSWLLCLSPSFLSSLFGRERQMKP